MKQLPEIIQEHFNISFSAADCLWKLFNQQESSHGDVKTADGLDWLVKDGWLARFIDDANSIPELIQHKMVVVKPNDTERIKVETTTVKRINNILSLL